jgi:hypothetical protein
MDGLDIPSFLQISQEERRKAWEEWKGFPNQPKAAVEDRGPGSVARRLGYPENPADAVARAELTAGILRAAEADKKEKAEARKAERAAQKAEREEIAAVKAAARAQHKKAA